jgi:hypothetical protein
MHTRYNGYFEPGFYKYKNMLNNKMPVENVSNQLSKRKNNNNLLVIGRKLNYYIVKELIANKHGLNTVRCSFDITNQQYNLLSHHFKISGKFKHFPGIFEKMNIDKKIYFNKKSVKIIANSLQLKSIKKPKLTYSIGDKSKTLNDGRSLHLMFKRR